nr:hypothetical protein CTI12_AA308240 [Tanacetum cinerariifolium]
MVTLKLMLFLLLTVVCQQQSSTGVVDGNGFPARLERFVMETESDGEDSFSTMVLAEERTRRKDPLNYFKYYEGGWNITDDHYFSVSLRVVDGNGFPARLERFVMETESDGEDSFSTMVLAEERTRRKDPLNYFKYYEGGWNITDDHYFSSVAYSAAPLFTIATIWFMGFGLSLLVICCYYLFRRRTSYGYSRTAYALSVAFLTLFTISAMVDTMVNEAATDLEFETSDNQDGIQYVLNSV